jgi:hypothetical protein
MNHLIISRPRLFLLLNSLSKVRYQFYLFKELFDHVLSPNENLLNSRLISAN